MKLTQERPENLKIADQKGRIALGSRYAGKHFTVREEADGTAILTPILLVPEKDNPLTARRIAESFAALESLRDDWDGQGSPAPASALVRYAREVVALLQASALARGVVWQSPHIGANERGQITLEWWQEERALTLFVRAEEQVDYLKAWGSNIETDMEDGEVGRIADFVALSRWLYQDGPQSV